MPFPSLANERINGFLRRERLHVDPALTNSYTDSEDVFTFDATPDFVARRLVSLELTDYCVSHDMTPAFWAESNDSFANRPSSSRWVDVRMSEVGNLSNTISFSVPLPTARNASPINTSFCLRDENVYLSVTLINLFSEYMNLQASDDGNTFFRTATYDQTYDYRTETNLSGPNGTVAFKTRVDGRFQSGNRGAFYLYAEDNDTADSIAVEFLFSTGPNAARSAWEALGYDEGVDVGGSAVFHGVTYYHPVPARALNLFPYRYVDVTIAQLPEFRERLYTTRSESYIGGRSSDRAKVRLYQNAPGNLDRLTFAVRLRGGLKPNAQSGTPPRLVLDALILAPQPRLPPYLLKQVMSIE